MGSNAYIEYINSEKWANKRAMKLLRSPHHCESCKRVPDFFHVHHLTYARLFHEDLGDLMVFCEPCHNRVESFIRAGRLSRNGDVKFLRSETKRLLYAERCKAPKLKKPERNKERMENRALQRHNAQIKCERELRKRQRKIAAQVARVAERARLKAQQKLEKSRTSADDVRDYLTEQREREKQRIIEAASLEVVAH